ncbi:DNA replication checkpoint mediator [Purpureocillium lavendulum]|uniref:DNA replication checkpoint mediator n=1 Tax=Purpureocillium lavendulum TaxID=1247861 RepID=A0AB34FV60_9HYPO|nr:DNA replication checkpoint mediator [Purpureocillium lavendulum]
MASPAEVPGDVIVIDSSDEEEFVKGRKRARPSVPQSPDSSDSSLSSVPSSKRLRLSSPVRGDSSGSEEGEIGESTSSQRSAKHGTETPRRGEQQQDTPVAGVPEEALPASAPPQHSAAQQAAAPQPAASDPPDLPSGVFMPEDAHFWILDSLSFRLPVLPKTRAGSWPSRLKDWVLVFVDHNVEHSASLTPAHVVAAYSYYLDNHSGLKLSKRKNAKQAAKQAEESGALTKQLDMARASSASRQKPEASTDPVKTSSLPVNGATGVAEAHPPQLMPLPNGADADPGMAPLSVSAEQLALQRRYFPSAEDPSNVCLSCASEGHTSQNCPNAYLTEEDGLACAYCSATDHLENHCLIKWRTFRAEPEAAKKVANVPMSCAICGGKDHYFSDCSSRRYPANPSYTLAARDKCTDRESESLSIEDAAAASRHGDGTATQGPDLRIRGHAGRNTIIHYSESDDTDSEFLGNRLAAAKTPTAASTDSAVTSCPCRNQHETAMASTEQLFLALLRSDEVQSAIARNLSTTDLCAVRTSSSACCNLITKRLFTRLHLTFTASSFTRPCRLDALSRVGHHVEHLTFYMPHSDATFLPPLVHPATGQEICFLYSPHTSMGSALARPKYANTELGEILTQQYPPLFHAATNVPSFINAVAMIPNLRHLTIRCPGQESTERYRRDVVDYALISLRIAVERSPLDKLTKLSLSSVHPAAFNYLRHIKKLHMSVEAWDFYGPSPGLDHLKIIDDYVRFFAPGLEKFAFSWVGATGPCPVALSGDALFAPPRASKKLFHEVTSPMSPLPTRPSRAPIHFPLSGLINAHRATVREFDFENVVLARKDSWDEALAPVMGDDSVVSDDGDEELPSPSAAVAAASRELLDVELGALGLDGGEEAEADERESRCETLTPAEEETMSFTTKLKKKRSPPPFHVFNIIHSSLESMRPSLRRSPFPPAPPSPKESTISAPILAADPRPVLLQPRTYDPCTPPAAADDGISSVQRDIEKEEAQRLLAEDASARASALQRAKEAVLAKLSREFCAAAVAHNKPRSRPGAGDAVAAEVLEDRRAS